MPQTDEKNSADDRIRTAYLCASGAAPQPLIRRPPESLTSNYISFPKSVLVEPASPRAQQLGMHFFMIAFRLTSRGASLRGAGLRRKERNRTKKYGGI